ncbi:DinB family protein [Longimicrobium sp.]|uniref:DinB family protein n=1 Tax=Longimicrobium sp. TaxID=2029185 RepID=UPI002CD0BC1E|nr:DinB family protein [Longimicrobium sp.]HSU13554.1 DinB family protein [Longimicrobium sp.]
MYRKIEDFERDWASESEATLKVLRELTDASLEQRVSPQGRSAGRLAWHLAGTVPELLGAAGLNGLEGPGEHDPVPERASEIVEAYERAARSVPGAVRSQWSDDELADEIPMYGQSWPKGQALSVLVLHQTHHRGQLTVLMRQAGLKVPGCYGPAAEEWAAMGMPAMA